MFWDVIFAIGIGLTQVGLTWYGVDVSVREKRIQNAVIIGIVGLLGIGLTVGSTIRNSVSQRRLQAQLDKIQKNTEVPPQVTVNIPPTTPPEIIVNPSQSRHIAAGFIQLADLPQLLDDGRIAEGIPIRINIFLINRGSEPVDGFLRSYALVFASVRGKDPNQVDRDIHAYFLKQAIQAAKGVKGRTIGIGEVHWNTIKSDPLTKEIADGMLDGTVRMYTYAWARWKDEIHDFDSCEWLQAPVVPQVDNKTAVWHLCSN